MIDLPLSTERLRLRRHAPRDRDDFVRLVTDPRFYAHLTVPEAQRTQDGARQVFDTILASYETEEPVLGLTMADADSDAFVGTVALHPIPFGEALEIFYAVFPDRWGDGLATEAVRALLDALPARDVVALAIPENEASKRVARAAGMTDDGVQQRVGGPARHRFVRPAVGADT